MSFKHGDLAFSNMHLFFGVDAVVFIEGGEESFPLEEVQKGKFNDSPIDSQFWEKIFVFFAPTKKILIRAVGSKSVLTQIADGISSGAIKNVCVAMDRDFDNFKGALKISPNVFYTQGYSWENDIWKPEILEVSLNTFTSRKIKPEIDLFFIQFAKDMHWGVYCDILLNQYSLSVIPRDKPGSLIVSDASRKPAINKTALRSIIKRHRIAHSSTQFRLGKHISYCPLNDCLGHLVERFFCRVFFYFIKNFTKLPSIPRKVVGAIMIDKFVSLLGKDFLKPVHKHYEEQFARLRI
ncbi:MAG: DUF4435 domain-containing protein [Deltaproteobacteria bacterium]|nr:DUF4435 domain-containing protein [Deltaproteobacteria bacterium]